MSDFESPALVREGLPPSYRMRAETHYVDFLETHSSHLRERGTADLPDAVAPLTGCEPTSHRTVSPAPTDRQAELAGGVGVSIADPVLHAGRDLAQSLATLSACTDLLSGSPSALSRAVIGNLIRAEAWRASALVDATRVLRQELPVVRAAVSVLGILNQVVQGFEPERKVRQIAIDSHSDLAHGSFLAGDEQMLIVGLTGAVLATLPLLEGVPNARLVVSAAVDGHQLTFAVTQEIVSAPSPWHARAFDASWTERPGGVPALVSLLALQQTAETHGGSASVGGVGRGTKISLAIPLGR